MISTLAQVHDTECLCPACLIADMENHIVATRGEEALARINKGAAQPNEINPVKTRSMKAGQRVGRGVVRSMSPKQKKFLVFLINTKVTTNLKLLPGQTINLAEIDTMGLPAAKAVIDKLQNCPNKPSNSVRMATDGQLRFIRSLNEQAGNVISEDDIKTIKFAEVQEVLDCLKTVIANNKKNAPKREITPGGYIQESTGKIFNVYKARTGTHLLVRVWNEQANDWEYVGSVTKLPIDARPMTLEESKAFGKLTVQCCQCGRKLTKKESKDKGIGPICEGRM